MMNLSLIYYILSGLIQRGYIDYSLIPLYQVTWKLWTVTGADPGGPWGSGPPLTTKTEAPAPKFYKIEAPEWQF